MRFFRRGPSESEPDQEPPEEPADDSSSESAEDAAADALIGDEWKTVASPDDVVVPEPTELELDLAGQPNAILGQLAPVEPVGQPEVQWAWGADYSPEKADAARREHERAQL